MHRLISRDFHDLPPEVGHQFSNGHPGGSIRQIQGGKSLTLQRPRQRLHGSPAPPKSVQQNHRRTATVMPVRAIPWERRDQHLRPVPPLGYSLHGLTMLGNRPAANRRTYRVDRWSGRVLEHRGETPRSRPAARRDSHYFFRVEDNTAVRSHGRSCRHCHSISSSLRLTKRRRPNRPVASFPKCARRRRSL